MNSAIKKICKTLLAMSVLVLGFSNIQTAIADDIVRPSDSNLEQKVEHNEAIVNELAEIKEGHIDIGPRIIDGKLGMYLRDDSVNPSVWRPLDKTVLRLNDKSKKKIPKKEEFAFIKTEADGVVYVCPQIQKEGVLWAGWNTQSPEIVENALKGAALRLLNVQGPGQLTMFLESGTFGPPTILWDSNKKEGQDVWMDLNTHTHANWVFTKPGAYLLNLELAVQMKDGSQKTIVKTLRFAVGDQISAQEVMKIKAKPNENNLTQQLKKELSRSGNETESFKSIMPLIYIGLGVVIIGLILVIFVAMRNKKIKKQAIKELEDI